MNYWIVSSHEFMLHASCDGAVAEAERLNAKLGKPFHVYRVKNKLIPGDEPGHVALAVSTVSHTKGL